LQVLTIHNANPFNFLVNSDEVGEDMLYLVEHAQNLQRLRIGDWDELWNTNWWATSIRFKPSGYDSHPLAFISAQRKQFQNMKDTAIPGRYPRADTAIDTIQVKHNMNTHMRLVEKLRAASSNPLFAVEMVDCMINGGKYSGVSTLCHIPWGK
jgi:hypothetical protein